MSLGVSFSISQPRECYRGLRSGCGPTTRGSNLRGRPNIGYPYLVNEKKFYLGQYPVVVLPVLRLARYLRGECGAAHQLRVRASHFSAYERSGTAYNQLKGLYRGDAGQIPFTRHNIPQDDGTYIKQEFLASPHGFLPNATVSPVSSQP